MPGPSRSDAVLSKKLFDMFMRDASSSLVHQDYNGVANNAKFALDLAIKENLGEKEVRFAAKSVLLGLKNACRDSEAASFLKEYRSLFKIGAKDCPAAVKDDVQPREVLMQAD